MRHRRDRDARTRLRDGAVIIGLLSSAVLFAALPLGVGVIVACLVPGLGGVRPGLGVPAVVAALVAVVALAVVLGERPVRAARLLLPGYPRLQRPVAEVGMFVVLAAALHAPLAHWIGAVTAAAVASAGYRCLEPFLRGRETGDRPSSRE